MCLEIPHLAHDRPLVGRGKRAAPPLRLFGSGNVLRDASKLILHNLGGDEDVFSVGFLPVACRIDGFCEGGA